MWELGIPFLVSRSSFLAFSAHRCTAVCSLLIRVTSQVRSTVHEERSTDEKRCIILSAISANRSPFIVYRIQRLLYIGKIVRDLGIGN